MPNAEENASAPKGYQCVEIYSAPEYQHSKHAPILSDMPDKSQKKGDKSTAGTRVGRADPRNLTPFVEGLTITF